MWVLWVRCCRHWYSFYQIDHSTLKWTVVGVNWLPLSQECHREVFSSRYCSSSTHRCLFPFLRISWSVMLVTPLWWLFLAIPRSDSYYSWVPEIWPRHGRKVSEGMKLNTGGWNRMRLRLLLWLSSRNGYCIPSHPHELLVELCWRGLMTLILYWELYLIPRWLLRSIFDRFPEQLLKDFVFWRHGVFHDRLLLGRCFRSFVLFVLEYYTVLQCGARLQIRTLNNCTAFPLTIRHCTPSICCRIIYVVYKIRCNPMHPLNSEVHVPYLPVWVYTWCFCRTSVHLCAFMRRTSQHRRTFIHLSVSVERSCWPRIWWYWTGGF